MNCEKSYCDTSVFIRNFKLANNWGVMISNKPRESTYFGALGCFVGGLGVFYFSPLTVVWFNDFPLRCRILTLLFGLIIISHC